ncbi:hypothetical protein LEMLEM_LOCUS25182, partial [Lemmus lemmus]
MNYYLQLHLSEWHSGIQPPPQPATPHTCFSSAAYAIAVRK